IAFFNFLGFRKLFILASVPSLVSVLLVLFFIKDEKNSKKIFNEVSLKAFSKKFKKFLFLSAIFSLGTFSYSFLLVFAKEFGFRIGFIPVLYLVFTATASITSIPFGRLSDIIGRKMVLEISFLFWLLTCVIFLVFRNWLGILIAFLFYGFFKGAIEPSQRAFVSELVDKEVRASALGGFGLIQGIFSLPASILAGIFWDKISIFAPFYFSIFLTLLSLFLLFKLK
ncbi:MAG: MFS transporter, partial [Candidatus Aenigmatarchaeota archaeon]